MQECCLFIHLFQFIIIVSGNDKYNFVGHELDNSSKRLVVIDVKLFFKAFDNSLSLMSYDFAVKVLFITINLFPS